MTKHPGGGADAESAPARCREDEAEATASEVYRYEFLLGDINATILYRRGTLRPKYDFASD
jgi:hypothetical protein